MLRHRLWSSTAITALTFAMPSISMGQAQSSPQWSVITTTQIKPEFRQEYEAIQKEITAAYKKAGAPSRLVVQTIIGDLDEYVSIAPLGKFGEMDGPSILAKALGDAGEQRLLHRIGAYLLGAHRVTSIALNDISIRTPMADPGAFAHVTFLRLAPGKGADFAAYMKDDYIPAMRKADVANLWLSQTVFGGNPNERVIVRPMHKLAEIDLGPLTTRALGLEGARQLMAKQNGIVESVHYTIVRVRPDLSLIPAPPEKPKAEQ